MSAVKEREQEDTLSEETNCNSCNPHSFTTTDVLLFLIEGLLAGWVLTYLYLLAMHTHKVPLFIPPSRLLWISCSTYHLFN